MKKFETPAIEVTKFDIADVITTSVKPGGGNGTMTPDDEL